MDTFNTDDIVFLYITIIQLIVLQLTSASSFNILGKIGELNYNSVVYIVMMLVSFFLYMIMCLLLKKRSYPAFLSGRCHDNTLQIIPI